MLVPALAHAGSVVSVHFVESPQNSLLCRLRLHDWNRSGRRNYYTSRVISLRSCRVSGRSSIQPVVASRNVSPKANSWQSCACESSVQHGRDWNRTYLRRPLCDTTDDYCSVRPFVYVSSFYLVRLLRKLRTQNRGSNKELVAMYTDLWNTPRTSCWRRNRG